MPNRTNIQRYANYFYNILTIGGEYGRIIIYFVISIVNGKEDAVYGQACRKICFASVQRPDDSV